MKTTTTKPPLQPLGDRVLLRPIEETERKVGGILLPQGYRTDAPRAEVIALGDGKPEAGQTVGHTFRVKVGDFVVVPAHNAPTIKIGEVRYQVRRESDILGVIP